MLTDMEFWHYRSLDWKLNWQNAWRSNNDWKESLGPRASCYIGIEVVARSMIRVSQMMKLRPLMVVNCSKHELQLLKELALALERCDKAEVYCA